MEALESLQVITAEMNQQLGKLTVIKEVLSLAVSYNEELPASYKNQLVELSKRIQGAET